MVSPLKTCMQGEGWPPVVAPRQQAGRAGQGPADGIARGLASRCRSSTSQPAACTCALVVPAGLLRIGRSLAGNAPTVAMAGKARASASCVRQLLPASESTATSASSSSWASGESLSVALSLEGAGGGEEWRRRRAPREKQSACRCQSQPNTAKAGPRWRRGGPSANGRAAPHLVARPLAPTCRRAAPRPCTAPRAGPVRAAARRARRGCCRAAAGWRSAAAAAAPGSCAPRWPAPGRARGREQGRALFVPAQRTPRHMRLRGPAADRLAEVLLDSRIG
jgi:hypothetical protein